MTGYSELVKALRLIGKEQDCNECEAGRWHHDFKCCLFDDAAAAIEALETEIRESMQKCAECGDEQEQKVKELQARLGEAENSAERWKDMYLTKHEPKRGEWVEENRRPRSSQFVCSECHRTAYDPQPTRDKAWRKRCRYAYCPNCGAKMREVQDGQ